MVLEKLADIYYVRDDYEACGQVLDMQAKVLDHCKRHSSVPGAAHDLMPFCEKTGYHMLSTQHSLNEKFGRYKTEIVVVNNQVIYKRAFTLNQGFYEKADYENFRKFIEQIARNDNAKVVLAKN